MHGLLLRKVLAGVLDLHRRQSDHLLERRILDREEGVPEEIEGHTRLVQLWFAGNHSDIGRSYPEVESRLSDIALAWMVEQATVIPGGLKVGPVTVNGVKMPGTGESGQALHLFPAADGVQHCEIAAMHDTIEKKTPAFLRRFTGSLNWEVKVREIKHDARVHSSVSERFGLKSVVQCAGSGAYRPEALKEHDAFKSNYPSHSISDGPASATSISGDMPAVPGPSPNT